MKNQQNVNELLDRAIEVWRREGLDPRDSDTEFYNLQNDPLTRLLLGAVLHQTDLIRDDIDSFKDDVVERYVDLGIPSYLLQPIPAIGMMQTGKSHKVGLENQMPTRLDASISFQVLPRGSQSKIPLQFVSLLEVSVYDVEVHTVEKIGKRRWRLEIEERESLMSLNGLSVYLPNAAGCSQIRLFSNGRMLEVANVDEFEKLPLVAPFLRGMRFSKSTTQCATLQNLYDSICCCVSTYCVVGENATPVQLVRSNGCLELEMELVGAPDELVIDKNDILLNCVPVMNVEICQASLSQSNPICRLDLNGKQFMSVATEEDTGIVAVRSIGTERLSINIWQHRMNGLIDSFDSEYNVIKSAVDERIVEMMRQHLLEMRCSMEERTVGEDVVYMILKDKNIPSVDIPWLATQGEDANGMGLEAVVTVSSAELDDAKTYFVTDTKGGRNAVTNKERRHYLMQYYQQSRDRIVTKSDIVIFCRHKLSECFRIGTAELVGITLRPDIVNTSDGFYERVLVVDIKIRRGVVDVESAQLAMERMIQFRTVGTSVIRVAIHEV